MNKTVIQPKNHPSRERRPVQRTSDALPCRLDQVKSSPLVAVLAGVVLLIPIGLQAASTWTGLGADSNWSTANNWSGNTAPTFPADLIFAGNTRLANVNDNSGITVNSITFDSAASPFVISGNAISLNDNIGFNANPSSPVTQSVNFGVTFNNNETIDTPVNGNLSLGGNLTANGNFLKIDSGTLSLGGSDTFSAYSVNGGTNIITGNVTINGTGGSRFYVGDGDALANCVGNLVIQPGAVLNVTGSFADAGVFGRDGGSATLIQNGGSFIYNPANESYMFIGAANNPSTQSTYLMNGGLLDMNNFTLGIGLGVNGAGITGLVYQVSGVITNVGTLDLGPITPNGIGVYTLAGGTIYIGSGGIVSDDGKYVVNLGGGTISAQTSWSSPLNLNLTNLNGSVTFDTAGNTITLSGALSGNGGLTVTNGGVLELSGATTYTGNTAVDAGSTLQLDTTGSTLGAFRLANGAFVNLNFSGTYAVAQLYTNGVAVGVGTYSAANLPGFIIGSGSLQVASGISTGHWTGLGADSNWSTANNWDNNADPIFPIALTFAGSTQLANNNDLSSITVNGITFDSAAGPFVISGNPITLNGSIGFNGAPASPATQTINLDMTFNASETIDVPTNANLVLGGGLTSYSDTSLIKLDSGSLTLGGTDMLLSGSLNGGTTIITGNTTINGDGNGRFYVADGDALTGCNSTLIIQPGATFSVIGSFADAGVFGRDTGSATIIQNGGYFSYNPNNEMYLFVGATSYAGTQSEYDMNGGVLDLNNLTLGVALSDRGVLSTSVVNQVSGSITNVNDFALGAIFSSGLGVYNLSGGSIYIGSGGITTSGRYALNLGGGIVGAEAAWSSSLNMNLTNLNGSVTFDTAGNTITLSGVLSGNGGLTVTGGGVLELSGANTYTGDTIVNAGSTLQLDATGSSLGSFRLANGAFLNLNFSGNYAVAHFYTNGVAVGVGTYTAANLPGIINGTGSIQVSSGISTGRWTGLGANGNWSTANNWDNGAVPIFPIAVTFAGNSELVNNNDLSGITASSITFDVAAGPFVINGNPISLNGNIGFNGIPAAPVTQAINLDMTFNNNETIDTPTNSSLILGGSLTVNAGFLKLDAGTLALGGNDNLNTITLNGGTNVITGNVTINGTGGSRFYVADGDSSANCNATLIIQPGATLSVIGNYGDSGVLGRDGGSATVIQNGGTFSFNPGNVGYLFVGAANNPATHSTYLMNGGLLDLNNYTLGLGLGVNGAGITGLLYHVSGVITNVSKLDFGPLTPDGIGVYTLAGGKIYLGNGGMVSDDGKYVVNLGGGTISAQAAWSSPLNMNLTNLNGSVTFDTAGNNITLSGALSGNGGLTVAGGGTLELSGANTYTGDTVVNASSILQLDGAGSTTGIFRLANGAFLNANFTGTYSVGALYTNGVAVANGTYNAGNLPGFIQGSGSVQVVGTIPTTPTNITFNLSSGHISLNWPAGYRGWILQVQTNSLSTGLGTNWVDVPGSANLTSTNIAVDPSVPTAFYRLRYPTP